MATVEELRLAIKAEVSDAVSKLKQVERQTKSTGDSAKGMGASFAAMRDAMQGPVAAAKAVIGAVKAVADGVDRMVMAAAESEKAMSNLKSVLASTGGVSGQTISSLTKFSDEMARMTLFEDEAVTQAQAVLLTFKAIGKDVFPQATKAAADMATVMGMDLQSATVMVGKALNEPIQGISTLKRAGVQLTDAQEKQIKQYMEVNDIMSAQKILLDELNNKYGGAAAAAADTATGKYSNMKKAIGELNEEFGKLVAQNGPWKMMTDQVSKLTDFFAGKNVSKDMVNRITELRKIWGPRGLSDVWEEQNQVLKKNIFTVEELDDAIVKTQEDIDGIFTVQSMGLRAAMFGPASALAGAIAEKKQAEQRLAILKNSRDVANEIARLQQKSPWATPATASSGSGAVTGQAATEAEVKQKRMADALIALKKKVLEEEVKMLKEGDEAFKGSIDDRLEAAAKAQKELDKLLEDEKKKYIDAQEDKKTSFDKMMDHIRKKKEEYDAADKKSEEDKKALRKENEANILGSLRNTISAMSDLDSNRTNNLIAQLEKQKEEYAKAGQDTTAIEKRIASERNALAERQFNANKANSIANIAISTAEGIMQAVKLGGPAGLAFGLGIGALGATQAGLVLGQEYTPMASGGYVDKPTRALIGEAGPEWVLNKSQMSKMGGVTIIQNINGSVWQTRELEGLALGAVAKAARGF